MRCIMGAVVLRLEAWAEHGNWMEEVGDAGGDDEAAVCVGLSGGQPESEDGAGVPWVGAERGSARVASGVAGEGAGRLSGRGVVGDAAGEHRASASDDGGVPGRVGSERGAAAADRDRERCGHGGWRCPSDQRCNAGKTYGKTVRVPRDIDLRRFPPIPRATRKFERLYKGRTAVERVNARFKIFWGADDGNIVGARRFHAHVGAVLIVHLGLATLLAAAPRREGTLGRMKLGPIAKALRARLGLKQ